MNFSNFSGYPIVKRNSVTGLFLRYERPAGSQRTTTIHTVTRNSVARDLLAVGEAGRHTGYDNDPGSHEKLGGAAFPA